MAPKKSALTSKALQSLLTRIGSASSGTKSTLLARFQRDVQRPILLHHRSGRNEQHPQHKLRLISIDMGIKNLAFCDAEVSYSAAKTSSEQGFNATMNVLHWKKIDLVQGKYKNCSRDAAENIQEDTHVAEDDADQFSPSVLSKMAYQLITEEVLSVNPDIILIEKQRWRTGGGSAVQQWTVRVNTLEAMLWAILETFKRRRQSRDPGGDSCGRQDAYQIYAVDPKRAGQYWLSQHARALKERDEEALAADMSPLSNVVEGPDYVEEEEEGEGGGKARKKPSRSKAEKSAKIAILRSWLADDTLSTLPSTPYSMPHISFDIDTSAEATRQALLPRDKATRKKRSSKAANDTELTKGLPTTEIKKLDDITDCFLQAAAWVAWESNRLELQAMFDTTKSTGQPSMDEGRILKIIELLGDA